MTMQQIEDANGTTVEVDTAAGGIELAICSNEYFICDDDGTVTVSAVLAPQQARALARQLLAQADAEEYGDED